MQRAQRCSAPSASRRCAWLLDGAVVGKALLCARRLWSMEHGRLAAELPSHPAVDFQWLLPLLLISPHCWLHHLNPCSVQVVGAHYQNEEAGFPTVVLCMNCCWEEQIIQASGAEDSSSAMQLRMPAPGQRLLPPLASGSGQDGSGGRWSWLGGAARSGGGVGGSGMASSGDGSSDESEDGGAPGGRRQRRRTSGSSQARLQQLRLQQQMEEQVYSAGGLLAAVARRLDGLALEAAAGGSGSGRWQPFEETLLNVVGQAQRILR